MLRATGLERHDGFLAGGGRPVLRANITHTLATSTRALAHALAHTIYDNVLCMAKLTNTIIIGYYSG
jgi:hypothetical protein